MKAKLFYILAMLILMVSMNTGCTLFANKIVLSNDNIISKSEADNAALYFMQTDYAEWENAELGGPTPYYWVADKTIPIVYEYTVLNDGEYIGYIIVSACKDLFPTLEGGNGAAPSSYIESARNVAEREEYITNDDVPVMLYWGALTYSVQFGEKMNKKGIAIHLPTGTIEKVPKQMYTQIDKEEAREAWRRLINITEK
jgi:hypothetical protein